MTMSTESPKRMDAKKFTSIPSVSTGELEVRARNSPPTPGPDSRTSPNATVRTSSTGSLLRRHRGRSSEDWGDGEQRVSFDTASLMSERVDAEISGRYEIDMREIGVGGYGKVFLAKDRRFKDRLVAIKKVVKIDEEKDCVFKKEVQIMKVLDHPCICRLFETYDQGRSMYFVIEYCEGGDLFDRYAEQGKLPETMVAPIVKQVASALKYAHSKGIAHRDLKLENICFCEKSASSTHVKVIDWGLAGKFLHGKMKSNVGTSTYSAPEVLERDPEDEDGYTCACDYWSLGVVAYVVLSGKPPFWGSPKQQLARMKAEQFPLAGPFWDTISADCKDFIRRLLRADEKDRMTADQVLAHTWLRLGEVEPNFQLLAQVLSNLEQFSHAPDFYSLCVASVARQLDHRSLNGIREAFWMLDKNRDGILDMDEVKQGFALAFGNIGEPEAVGEAEVQEIFSHLDLDGTERITYTEFCAAGLGEQSYTEEHVLWAAFKTFDIHDDGRITREELRQVLQRVDITQVWTSDVCEEVAQEVMDQFGSGSDSINFQEWLALMRECAARHQESSPRRFSKSLSGLQSESSGLLGNGEVASDALGREALRAMEAGWPGTGSGQATSQTGLLADASCCSGFSRMVREWSGRR
eukprot:TRINITY_DN26912_c0_g2_i1.p1 TRINITY_DN26912_c0_g2~~TRINITY_DN26912_c0_g2_i1.p1  ORF type:complete len:637 (-),score=123.01 TRINITY_DN26912_c0_g2_i1:52-1962(-)